MAENHCSDLCVQSIDLVNLRPHLVFHAEKNVFFYGQNLVFFRSKYGVFFSGQNMAFFTVKIWRFFRVKNMDVIWEREREKSKNMGLGRMLCKILATRRRMQLQTYQTRFHFIVLPRGTVGEWSGHTACACMNTNQRPTLWTGVEVGLRLHGGMFRLRL